MSVLRATSRARGGRALTLAVRATAAAATAGADLTAAISSANALHAETPPTPAEVKSELSAEAGGIRTRWD